MKLSDLFLPQEEWLTLKVGRKSCKLLIRSREYDAYRLAVDNILRKCREDDTLDILSLTRDAVANHLIADWDLTDDNGDPLKYDPALAIDLFKLNSASFKAVTKKAEEIELRNAQIFEDTVKK